MTDTHILRATGPADLLALVPGLIGFHPEDSVVLLTVGPARQPFHARVDLPDDPVGVELLTAHLAEVADRHGTRRLAVLVYSDDAALAEAVVDQLLVRLALADVAVVCAVRADGERWWPLTGGGEAGEGTPYDLTAHPLVAQAVLDGTRMLGSRRELADSLVGPDTDEVDRVAALAQECDAGPALDRHRLAGEARWVQERVRHGLVRGHRLDTADAARLLQVVRRSVELRDVAWAEMTHANADRHVALWLDLVRRAPVELRAAPAALLGFAAWLCGDGALAWCAVDAAQEAEPGYGLAGLLTDALAGAVPPSAWRPIPPGALGVLAD
jgi:hypothetical protein